ncbi:LysR family transcriptional regulator [Glaciimonas immobilis]|uniref:DNA-binding transcriptional LysR family regulator n=1 Tax=Glaciimonas immobilis TaxID=728004 RepID=A0A840RU80_9BURK|nr:LysR family transcriptional regulator [Glaciimonas immobilis]KAF3999954.1 LysR family transcriptional regulator [Glaciimonas immobilis]MBB5200456.1 DNA-binding transcriptional LysR family regulator [Glaciimonas immobilis]
MNLTLEALQILDTIDRKGSFGAAAIALDRVPSALTYSIRKLEEDLDVLLFDRTGHRARLTGAGLELLTEGRHLLQAAQELERRVKRTATGWEVELRIVLDSIVPFEALMPLIAAFDRENAGTRLRIFHEALSGVWEALINDRADLAIGAPHDGPDYIRMSGDFQTRHLGTTEWAFAVAPQHPLALAAEPLTANIIQQYRAIAVGDTGRVLPSITSGLLIGQDILTVPTMSAKLQAQLNGLGCGHLPRRTAEPYFLSGALIEKQTLEEKPGVKMKIAWRAPALGKSLKWVIQQLNDPETARHLIQWP